jgi:Aromatic acid exporter family member 2
VASVDPCYDWCATLLFCLYFPSLCSCGITGCGASFIIMMLPPKSGRKAVRLRAASSIGALSHVYTSLMSAWITESDMDKGSSFTSSDWVKAFRGRLIAVTLQILAGKQYMMFASWEGGIRGRWPQEEYARLTEVQEEIVAVLAQVRYAEKA